MGGYGTKEQLSNTPNTPSNEDRVLTSHDPRSPDVFGRTPILVQDPCFDPRSPAQEDVDRTPIFMKQEPSSPIVRYKLENAAYVDSPLSLIESKKRSLEETSVNSSQDIDTNDSESEMFKKDSFLKGRNNQSHNLLRTALFKSNNYKNLEEDEALEKENSLNVSDENNSVLVNQNINEKRNITLLR